MRTVRIGNQDYEIHYGQNAICALEDELDSPVFALVHRIDAGENLGMRDIRALLWAGLLAKRRNITIEAAGNLLDEEGVSLRELLIECGTELCASLGRIIQHDSDNEGNEVPAKNE